MKKKPAETTPKTASAKKPTPQSKKSASAVSPSPPTNPPPTDKAPEEPTKSTSRTAVAAASKVTKGKQQTIPKPELKEESPTEAAEEKKPDAVATKTVVKKQAGKAKSLPTSKSAATPNADENMEEDPEEEQQPDEENAEEEGTEEPGDGEKMQEGEEGAEGVDDEGEDAGEEEGGGFAEEEQMEITDMATRRKMKKEREIFVGGIDRDATEDDIKKAFEKIGEVTEVRLHRDLVSNKNKGYAFVMFGQKEHAARALLELKNPIVRGKRCGIAPSEDNDTLFIGNICNTWTKEAIKRKMKEYGVDGVEHITLVEDTQKEGLSRGFAFLEFSCHADAMLAYKRLQKPDVVFGHAERTLKVAFAEPLREPDAEIMAQVKSVFVDGLPPYWDEDRVKEQLKEYGVIERVVLARNMPSAKRKDFGFVNFTSHEEAMACIEALNNTELGDGKSKLKARARLANPLPKTQAVKGGMRGGFRIGYVGFGTYPRFGRGFGRGRFFSNREAFRGGRGFNQHGRGRFGRFPYTDDMDSSYSDFQGRRPFGIRGGRRGAFRGAFQGSTDEFAHTGMPFQSRMHTFQEGEFGRQMGTNQYGDDSYLYGEAGRGMKRPFSMIENDPGYLESGSRLRSRYDYEPFSGGSRYQDSPGIGGSYSRDYYGSDYGGGYSSFYGGDHSGGSYYY